MLQILKFKKTAMAACGTLLLISATSHAAAGTLPTATFALIAQSTNDPSGVISNGGSSVTLSTPGSSVTIGLYMILDGDSTPGDQGVQNAKGSFVGPTSGELGNFTVATQGSQFGGLSYSNGTLVNSNNTNPATENLGDDTTLGTAATTPADDFIAVSSNSPSGYATGTSLDGNGNTDILLGTTTFTLLSTDSTGTSNLQFIPNYVTGTGTLSKNQKFEIAGVNYATNALGYTGSTQTVNLTEQLLSLTLAPTSTPEPTSLSLLALSGIAMMRRRRTSRVATSK